MCLRLALVLVTLSLMPCSARATSYEVIKELSLAGQWHLRADSTPREAQIWLWAQAKRADDRLNVAWARFKTLVPKSKWPKLTQWQRDWIANRTKWTGGDPELLRHALDDTSSDVAQNLFIYTKLNDERTEVLTKIGDAMAANPGH